MKLTTVMVAGIAFLLTACPHPQVTPPPSFPPSWETLIRKGDIEQEYWRYAEAEYYYSQAVTRAQEFGADDPRLARSLQSLSSVTSRRGNYAVAWAYAEQALSMYRHLYGTSSGEVGMTEYVLGNIAADYGTLREAEQRYTQSQRHIAAAYGPQDPRLGQPMMGLASLYLMTNRVGEAESLVRQVVTLWETFESTDPSKLCLALRHLGALLLTQKRLAEAEPILKRSYETAQKRLGDNHPQTAASLSTWAALHLVRGHPEEAEPLYSQVIHQVERSSGTSHPEVAVALTNHADALFAIKHYAHAEQQLRRAIAIYEQQTGPSSAKLANTLVSLAVAVWRQGRKDAEPLFTRGLTLTESTYGPDHVVLANALGLYAQFLRDQDRNAEADAFAERAESIRAKSTPGHSTS